MNYEFFIGWLIGMTLGAVPILIYLIRELNDCD